MLSFISFKRLNIILITLSIILFTVTAYAGNAFVYPRFKAIDGNGNPIRGGLLYTYVAGTSTAKATYSDKECSTANANPVVLDSNGEATVYLLGTYKMNLKTSSGGQVPGWPVDNVDGLAASYVDFYYPDYSAADQGLTGDSNTIKYYVDTIGATNKATIYLRHNSGSEYTDYVFSTAETIPANITLMVEAGSRLSIATGIIVAINGRLVYNSYKQIFLCNGTGYVTLGENSVDSLLVTLWGVGYGADDTTNFQKVFYANAAGIATPVDLGSGTITVNSEIEVNPLNTDNVVPEIFGNGAGVSEIKAGATLGANPILSHQGSSPAYNIKWSGFKLTGTGAGDGQYGIKSVNTCFVNYDNIVFDALDSAISFENVAAGYSEQNALTNCWINAGKYGLRLTRQAASTADSFRGTGFASNCHMNLSTVADARAIYVNNDSTLEPNLYDAPCFLSVWVGAGDYVTQNDSSTPIRLYGNLIYESAALGWYLGIGSAADTFRGNIEGISFNPDLGTHTVSGLVGGKLYYYTSESPHNVLGDDPELILYGTAAAGTHYSYLKWKNNAGTKFAEIFGSYLGGVTELVYNVITGWEHIFTINDVDVLRIKTTGLNITGVSAYANNAAALAGGLVAGDLYRTGADPDVICIVH